MRETTASKLVVLVLALVACTCRRAPVDEDTPFEPEPVHAPRPLRDLTVPRTPERVARGRYLAEGLLQCFVCHSERDWNAPGAPPIAGRKGAGQVWPDRPWLVAPNLTPDPETGTGRWTDDMLLRAIREGVSHDGRPLHPQMWSASFRTLPDEDAEAVVAYLRTLTPIRNPLPATALPADVAKRLTVREPITSPVPQRAEADPVQRGLRLASLADCAGCHSSWHTPKNPGLYGGGNLIEHGTVKAWSANLTTDPSGIPHYDSAFFREVMRTGRAKGRALSPLMPWIVFRNLSDGDLDDLFAYLRAIPPVKHVLDNVDSPTKCPRCGGEHPLGRYNPATAPAFVPFPLASVRDAVGHYRSEGGYLLQVGIRKGVFALLDRDDECPLVTEDRRTFLCEGDTFRFEFIRDATGRVTHVVDNRVERAVKVK
jgi:mono/diheme cytochrome c family protein